MTRILLIALLPAIVLSACSGHSTAASPEPAAYGAAIVELSLIHI